HDLHVSLRLNGETMQDSNTKQMIFPIPELISYLSRLFTLEVGDVIATGTPSGVGFARRPPIFLQDGDLVEIEIEGIGVLRNPVVKER
ncbi:MAG: fumarylacetoacetate hydrolase family protein, partial [Limnochordia bacterium]|nr:fumarylacetoacetate hydrolase family protein [Limnochordia bacterium]